MLRRWLVGGGVIAGLVAVSSSSEAHFILQAPTNWVVQDTLGLPEKLGPCGDEYGDAAVPSGVVTAYKVGDTITITVNEVIFHPGHYRIAIGNPGPGNLPAEPAVTVGATPCGSAAIESPAVFPVLADNVFPHTTAFSAPQTTTVQLPSGFSCNECTLQVIEFMSDHPLNNPGGCFYHHCANISVGATDAGTTPPSDAAVTGDGSSGDGSSGTPPDAGAPGSEQENTQSGCNCSVPGGTSGTPWALGAFFATLWSCVYRASRRRKRR